MNGDGALAAELQVEVRNHGRSIEAHHTAIGSLRERAAAHDTAIGVIGTELREAREDVHGMSSRLERLDERLDQRFSRLGRETTARLEETKKAFYVTAASLAGMMLSICGLIAVLLSNAS